jgi:hypothetical protein
MGVEAAHEGSHTEAIKWCGREVNDMAGARI